MIKMKYYGSRDKLLSEGSTLSEDKGAFLIYSEEKFLRLMCGVAGEPDYEPFRDAESRRLLKETWGIELIEGDWYSVDCGGYRTCMADLCPELKYALTLIDASRKGQYMSCEDIPENVWNVLDSLDFDILIAISWEDIWWISRKIPSGVEYLIQNFPLYGGIDVQILEWGKLKGEFYTPVGGENENVFADGIFIGKDGKYYGYDPMGHFRFFWRDHIDEMLNYIDHMKAPKKLKMIEDEYSPFEFGRMMEPTIPRNWFEDEYLWQLDMLKDELKKRKISYKEFKAEKKKLKEKECYQEHLKRRDADKIVNHMYTLPPKDLVSRKLPILSVRWWKDGKWFIGGGISDKYPYQEEILDDALDMRSEEYDTFLVYVDVEEIISSPKDLRHTEWCIWVRQDRIELFDKADGLRLFAALIRKALASDKCEISHEFY